MPMFEIESYKVSSFLQRPSGEPKPSRVLEMTGPVLYHGIQNKALFAFTPGFGGTWTTPVAGYLTDGGFSGLTAVGWFPLVEYSYYYEILQTERPVQVIYEFRDAGATSGYLKEIGLGTSLEQIGEGPTDSSEELDRLLTEHLHPVQRIVPLPTRDDLLEQTK